MSKQFVISKNGGKFTNVKAWKEHINSLADGRYIISIKSYKERSLPQNAWFHAILPDVLAALRNIGYNEIRTTEDAKDFLKALFFRKKVSNGIDTVEVIERTSEQSKEDFTEKAEDIIIWAATYLNIDIAPPAKQFELYG